MKQLTTRISAPSENLRKEIMPFRDAKNSLSQHIGRCMGNPTKTGRFRLSKTKDQLNSKKTLLAYFGSACAGATSLKTTLFTQKKQQRSRNSDPSSCLIGWGEPAYMEQWWVREWVNTTVQSDLLVGLVVSNIFCFHHYLGRWSNLTDIFQRGWNHQLGDGLLFLP